MTVILLKMTMAELVGETQEVIITCAVLILIRGNTRIMAVYMTATKNMKRLPIQVKDLFRAFLMIKCLLNIPL